MNAIPYDTAEQDWENTEEQDVVLPGRPRRRIWTAPTAILLALVVGLVGFYVGIRVEKSQVHSSTGTGLASASGATGAASGARTGGASRSAEGGFGRFAGGGSGSGNTIGTVSSVKGNTLYVTSVTGNTVKVTLSSATKVTKSQTARRSAIRPGDSVVVQGIGSKGSSATIAAASVNDTGARSAGGGFGGGGFGGAGGADGGSGAGGASGSGGAQSGGSSSSSGGTNSAVNSLFGSGGG